jgi:two-component system, OmpR family, sensor histidine kinase BaeS
MSPRHIPRRQPRWWPADEPWPPADSERMRAWHEMRGRFFWRIGGLFVLFFVFVWGCTALSVWLAASLLGILDIPARSVVNIAIPLILIFAGLLLAARSLRHVAMPIGDMIEAAGRVAEGDYAARVVERGPREVRALAHAFNAMAARLQANDEQRRNLLADVTHELRTPLTVIQGNLEGLIDGVYPRDDGHLTPILEETRVLSRLIDDLRTLALAESGALKLQKEPTDLAVLTSETVASFRAQADAAGVELSAEVTTEMPAIELDPARIRQVLENLIANALRFTPRGGRISVRCSVLSSQSKSVAVSVSDTGAGIPPDELLHIFERFYKSRDSRGTGLGLAIAKNLIAAHGGEISAQSEPGKGTTIRFSLPVV